MSETEALPTLEDHENLDVIHAPQVVVLDYDRTFVDGEDSFDLTLKHADALGANSKFYSDIEVSPKYFTTNSSSSPG